MERCFRRQMKLKQKLILVNVLIVGVMLISLSVFFGTKIRKLIYDEWKSSFQHTTTQIVDNMNYKIEKINTIISQIAYNEKVQSAMLNTDVDINLLVENYRMFVLPMMESPLLLNEELLGITIYTLNEAPESGKAVLSFEHIKEKEWAREVIGNNDLSICWYYEDGHLFATKKYVSSYTGECIGLIYAELDKAGLFSDIVNVNTAVDGVWINTKNARRAFSFGDTAEEISSKMPDEAAQNEMVKVGKEGYFLRKAIGSTGLEADFFWRDTELQKKTNAIGTQIILMAVIYLILSSIVIDILFGRFLKGIRLLKESMDQVREGNLEVEVPVYDNDEIGSLTRDFNYMMQRVNELIQQVYITRLKLQEAEYTVLQAQISPHFLYNALSLINWKALEAGADEVGVAAIELSRFYRTALSNNRQMIQVYEEIQNISSYIHIQLMMHDASFEVHYELDKGGDAFLIPKFILQPIVENGIMHGIDKRIDGGGVLTVISRTEGDDIVFQIIDNGPGFDGGSSVTRKLEKTSGYGMTNVQSRLEFLYGTQDGYGIRMERKEELTVVTVRVRDYRTMKDDLGLLDGQ